MSEYMAGRKSPALSNSMAIADALGISLDELAGRNTSEPHMREKPVLLNGWARVQQFGDEHGFHPDDVLLIMDANERLKERARKARAQKAEEEKK